MASETSSYATSDEGSRGEYGKSYPGNAWPRYLVIEGPIGVGKTTLVEKLAYRFGTQTLLEVFEENPFLADFYREPKRWAFHTEIFFLLSRYRQQEEFAQVDLFSRFAVSDYLFDKCRLFASLTLSTHELALYDRTYHVLTQQVPRPDMVIHLRASLDTLMKRIAQRGRSFEQHIDPDYLDRLRALYRTFFNHYREAPLLEIDTESVNFTEDDQAVDDLVDLIVEKYNLSRAP